MLDDSLQEASFAIAPADIAPGPAPCHITCVNTPRIAVPEEVEEEREQAEEEVRREASAYDHPPTEDAQWDASFENQGNTFLYCSVVLLTVDRLADRYDSYAEEMR